MSLGQKTGTIYIQRPRLLLKQVRYITSTRATLLPMHTTPQIHAHAHARAHTHTHTHLRKPNLAPPLAPGPYCLLVPPFQPRLQPPHLTHTSCILQWKPERSKQHSWFWSPFVMGLSPRYQGTYIINMTPCFKVNSARPPWTCPQSTHTWITHCLLLLTRQSETGLHSTYCSQLPTGEEIPATVLHTCTHANLL